MWKLRERLKKQEEEKQNRPIDPLLPFGLRRGMPGQMFKLMQIFDLQAVEITACLCERNLAVIQGVQHRSHKGVTEDMLGFPMAVLPTATLYSGWLILDTKTREN